MEPAIFTFTDGMIPRKDMLKEGESHGLTWAKDES
jgi:hypothetical protein